MKLVFFTGTIFNFAELGFCGDQSDALLAFLQKKGIGAISELRGSFAFAAQESEVTYLVRDQLGIVPFYYYKKNPHIFGTSVRELLRKGVPRKLSKSGFHSYLAYGAVQDPQTLIEDVYCLPPAMYLKILSDGTIELESYWEPLFDLKNFTPEDAQRKIDVLLKSAIKECCDTDSKLPAAFLSGGIDSSAIVALMRQVYPDAQIRTYCVVHEDPHTDERKWARLVAEKNKTHHTELLLTAEMIKSFLREAIDDYDQPSIDGLNVWFASKLISGTGEKVVLSGIGGDELFMGYGQFFKHRLAYKYSKYLKYIPTWCGELLEAISSNEKVRKVAQLMGYKSDPYYLPRRIFSERYIKLLIKRGIGDLPEFEQLGGNAPNDDLLNRISWLELRTSVLSMYLRDGYQTSLPHGLSMRAPLLDKRLVDMLFQISSTLKVNVRLAKPMLVKAADEGIPKECIVRKKMGFSLPFDLYFREVLKEELNNFFINGDTQLFNLKALQKLKRQYDCGKISWSRIWALYMVDVWCKKNGVYV